MKVLHVLETWLPVSENWIYPQVVRVRGAEPAVLCGGTTNEELFPLRGAPLVLDPPPWRAALGLPRLINSLAFRLGWPGWAAARAGRRLRPEVIHAHFGMRGWQSLGLRRELGVPLITSFYGMDAWQLPHTSALWRERYAELFAQGELFLAEGPAMRERLIAIGAPAERVRVVRLGVEVEKLPFDAKTFAAPLRMVMMSRFIEKKGMPDGLLACAEAIRGGADLQIRIIGDAARGDEAGERIKADLREIAAGDALRGRVQFDGFLKPAEARAILRESHVFLCPSKHSADGDAEGGSPLSLTEAMALGLLCIGTCHCDIPEVIRHGETGLLADSGDIPALAAQLTEAARAPERMPALCRSGRAHIETHFSTAAQVEALAEVYRGLASGTPK